MDINELKNRKKKLKLTTAQLAYLADLPTSTVSKIMTGETKNPSFITIEKINRTLLAKEMELRILAYKKAMEEYLTSMAPEEDFDIALFERQYRLDNNLNDMPIPFATNKDESFSEFGNLTLSKDYRINLSMLNQIGEDKNVELIDGRLIINQEPDVSHQLLVQNIAKLIDKYIDDNKGCCKLFSTGVNVILDEDDYTLLIPDIVLVCDEEIIREKGIYGVPDFVIEVVSKNTRKNDYNDKMHKYMHAGVREYWIVDPQYERVTVYTGTEPMLAFVYKFEDSVPVCIYEGNLEINIGNFFPK